MGWAPWLLFDFSGRVGRGGWWFGLLLLIVEAVAGGYVVQPELFDLEADYAPPRSIGSKILSLALAVPSFALAIKRPNDRDWPHWVFWLAVVGSALLYIGPFFGYYVNDLGLWTREVWFGLIPLGLVSAWLLIDNGFLRGTDEANRYWADPRRGTRANGPLAASRVCADRLACY